MGSWGGVGATYTITENSSAIDRGPGPRSKSDEFFVCNPLFIKQGPIQCLKPLKQCCTFWDPESESVAES